MWALYSEKNGVLDSVIVDKNHKMYKAVGLGEGGVIPPPLKQKLKRRGNVVEVPLSALDEVAWNLVEFSYKPLVQSAKNIGFSFFSFGLMNDADSSYGDWANLSKDMYETFGLEMPSQDELKKHKRCSCVPGAALEGTPATPYSRGVLEILKGVGNPQNK